jgi:hypothetical protein
MNRDEIEKKLDECLLNDQEMTTDWSRINDPLTLFTA